MTHHKISLPQKICPVCQRPFLWRKKWANCWSEVRYCSERCRRQPSQKNVMTRGLGGDS